MRIRLALLALLVLGSPALAKLNVVTTTEDLASIVKSIGADEVEVTAIAKGDQDPHFIQAKPSTMVRLSRADLVVSSGLALEVGWLPILIRGSRQPGLLFGKPGNLVVGESIEPIEVLGNTADRSQGDIHPFGNPHFMADPERGLVAGRVIAARLGELDPSHKGAYDAAYAKWKSALETKISDWKRRMAPLKGAKVIGFHRTFNYFLKLFGMTPVGYLEPKPGLPPTAQHALDLVKQGKEEKVKLVVVENYFDLKAPERVATEIGAKLVVIPAYTGGDAKSDTYENWLETLVSAMERSGKP